MAQPVPFPTGLKLQAAESGSFPKPHSSLVWVYEAGTALALGALVQIDPSDTTQVIALDAGAAASMLGVVLGAVVNGHLDVNDAPAAGEQVAIAAPPCKAAVLLGGTVSAGAALMVNSTDGEVISWTPGNAVVAYAMEAGVDGDTILAQLAAPQAQDGTQMWTRIAGANLAIGALVEVDAAAPTEVVALDAATPYLFAGVVIGSLVNGRVDRTTAPDEDDVAVIAIPPCIEDVIIDATIAAGAPITPDAATDGRVDAWADGDSMVGFLLEGGDQNDLCQAYLFPIKLYVTEPA